MKLFIDSSTSYLYLALIDNKKKSSYLRFGKNDHSETLTENLDKFLKENSVDIKNLEEVLIGRGPGSYTGLRIAGTVGKVMCFAKKISFKSFSSLDLLLASHLEKDGKYIARIVAKKNHSYIKVIEKIQDKISIIVDDCFVEDSELVKYDDYLEIMANENTLATPKNAQTIIDYNLTKEESVYDYVPNYLRSGV